MNKECEIFHQYTYKVTYVYANQDDLEYYMGRKNGYILIVDEDKKKPYVVTKKLIAREHSICHNCVNVPDISQFTIEQLFPKNQKIEQNKIINTNDTQLNLFTP